MAEAKTVRLLCGDSWLVPHIAAVFSVVLVDKPQSQSRIRTSSPASSLNHLKSIRENELIGNNDLLQ